MNTQKPTQQSTLTLSVDLLRTLLFTIDCELNRLDYLAQTDNLHKGDQIYKKRLTEIRGAVSDYRIKLINFNNNNK